MVSALVSISLPFVCTCGGHRATKRSRFPHFTFRKSPTYSYLLIDQPKGRTDSWWDAPWQFHHRFESLRKMSVCAGCRSNNRDFGKPNKTCLDTDSRRKDGQRHTGRAVNAGCNKLLTETFVLKFMLIIVLIPKLIIYHSGFSMGVFSHCLYSFHVEQLLDVLKYT